MFENGFNLKFNLHKAYIDIGVEDSLQRIAVAYGFENVEQVNEVLKTFEKNVKSAAHEVRESCAKKPNSRKKINITYLGDSITSERESHLHIMKQLLKAFDNIKVYDTAISGYKSGDVLTAMQLNIIPTNPNVSVIMIGTNDVRRTNDGTEIMHTSIEEYERNLKYILYSLKQAGSKVLICTLPPFDMEKSTQALPQFKILYKEEDLINYNDLIEKCAKEFNVILVDMRKVYAEYNAKDITMEDGVHLNLKGQTLLTKNIYPLLIDEIDKV